MNLLNEALPALQGLINNQKIKILNSSIENVGGFAKETTSEIVTFAHVQPLNPSEIVKLTSGTLDSAKYYKFYIIENLAEVLSSVSKVDAVIEWNAFNFRVFYKEDWALNGWIMVIATQINKELAEDIF